MNDLRFAAYAQLCLVAMAGAASANEWQAEISAAAEGVTVRPLSDIPIDVRIRDRELPVDVSGGLFKSAASWQLGRPDAAELHFSWEPSQLTYQPLYFDDIPLERYGQMSHPWLQPWLSAARFYVAFPLMPYKMVVDGPFCRVTPLGLYRPGSPTPSIAQTLPALHAAHVGAAARGAFVFLVP